MRGRGAVFLALALALGLAGCAPSGSAPSYSATAADQLQSVVLEVSEAASAGDHAAAAGALDELESTTIAAFSRGELTDARFDAIMVAIGLVRSDLESVIAQEAEETREPTTDPVPADPGTTDTGSGGGTSGGSTSGGGTSGGSDGKTSNGRGNPGVPGPPDDRGKPKG